MKKINEAKIVELKIIIILSTILGILFAISSICGLLYSDILYASLNEYYLANIIPQDIANLCIVFPIFIISLVYIVRGSIIALFTWMGCILTMAYVGITYSFTIPFNHLFLVYIAIFGLSFYTLIYSLMTINYDRIKSQYNTEASTRYAAVFLIIVFIAMYGLWLSDAIPKSISGVLPQNAVDIGFPTSPFHIIDLALLFPGFLIAGVVLKKKKTIGYFLAPAYLTLNTIFGFILEILSIYLMIQGFGLWEDIIIFGLIPIISLIVFLKFIKKFDQIDK